jgi:hypothetical protein
MFVIMLIPAIINMQGGAIKPSERVLALLPAVPGLPTGAAFLYDRGHVLDVLGAAGFVQAWGIFHTQVAHGFEERPDDVLLQASCVVGESVKGHDCASAFGCSQ